MHIMNKSMTSLGESDHVGVSVVDTVELGEEDVSQDPSRTLGLGNIKRHEGSYALL
jgi:hypothetical protein